MRFLWFSTVSFIVVEERGTVVATYCIHWCGAITMKIDLFYVGFVFAAIILKRKYLVSVENLLRLFVGLSECVTCSRCTHLMNGTTLANIRATHNIDADSNVFSFTHMIQTIFSINQSYR